MLRRMPRRWPTRLRIKLKRLTKPAADPSRPFFMHPLVFLAGWAALGILFGFQELMEMSFGDWKIPLWMPFVSWTVCHRFSVGLLFVCRSRSSSLMNYTVPTFHA